MAISARGPADEVGWIFTFVFLCFCFLCFHDSAELKLYQVFRTCTTEIEIAADVHRPKMTALSQALDEAKVSDGSQSYDACGINRPFQSMHD